MTVSSNAHIAIPVLPSSSSALPQVAYSAVLTLALSLPQGLLALPIAVAQVGLARGLLILLVIGALNVVTTAWTAQAVATYFTRHATVPSLPRLAHDQLGIWGRLLALASGAALFFMALVASVVGLARSLADLTGAPALLGAVGCSLVILLFLLARVVLSMRLLVGLGLLNVGLLVILLILMLPHIQPIAVPVPAGGSPIAIFGVSMMLFFAPMLVAQVAHHVLPRGDSPQAFVVGSAVGVAGGTVLFALWAIAVCSVAGAPNLAESTGTLIPVFVAAMPEARLLAMLLGFSLLGMTALRCALVLTTLAEEQLPAQLGKRSRRLAAQLLAGLGLAVAAALLLAGATTFTHLIAIAGGGAASLASLLIPTLLACARPAVKRRIVHRLCRLHRFLYS